MRQFCFGCVVDIVVELKFFFPAGEVVGAEDGEGLYFGFVVFSEQFGVVVVEFVGLDDVGVDRFGEGDQQESDNDLQPRDRLPHVPIIYESNIFCLHKNDKPNKIALNDDEDADLIKKQRKRNKSTGIALQLDKM